MRRLLTSGLLIALVGCSSAPEKPDPTPLKRITELVELDDVESTSLGGGDQTGLSPAVDGGVIAAARSMVCREMYNGRNVPLGLS